MGLTLPPRPSGRYVEKREKPKRVKKYQWTRTRLHESVGSFIIPWWQRSDENLLIYWLHWEWSQTEKKELYEQVLEGTVISKPSVPDFRSGGIVGGGILAMVDGGESIIPNLVSTSFGFFVYHGDLLLGEASAESVTVSVARDEIEVTSMDSPPGEREFIPGRGNGQVSFEISDFRVGDPTYFQEFSNVYIHFSSPEGLVYQCLALWIEMGLNGSIDGINRSSLFRADGEVTMETDVP